MTGYSFMFDCLLRDSVYSAPLWNKFPGWNSWFKFHIIVYKSDQHFQYSIVPPDISPITKSCLTGAEDMLQCLWFVITLGTGRITFSHLKRLFLEESWSYVEHMRKLNLRGVICHMTAIDFCKVSLKFIYWPCWFVCYLMANQPSQVI